MKQDRPWHESDNPSTVVRGATWRTFVWIAAVVVLIGVIGGGIWLFTVVTAPVTGAGNAFRQQQGANNRIAAQQRFEELIADINQSDAKLDQAAADLKANPTDQVTRANYTGLKNHCLDTVGLYNAEARKYTAAQFRASDLPERINPNDPETDCKEKTP